MSTGSENEPAKLLLPYLQRADELQKHDPLVAYYCNLISSILFYFYNFFIITLINTNYLIVIWVFSGRLYAMERGLKIPQTDRTKTTNSLLVSLMKQLEKVILSLFGCLFCFEFVFVNGSIFDLSRNLLTIE